jgi:hypothetical protein
MYGQTTLVMQCFRERFFDLERFTSYFTASMPWMVDAFKGLSGADKATFMKNLELGSRRGAISEKPINMYEAENFVSLMTYVESLEKRFDVRRTGQMYLQEALGAFPLVCPKLRDLSHLPGSCKPRWGLLEALFGHLLVFGSAPKKAGPSLGDKIVTGAEFLAWTLRWLTLRHCTHCSYRVDRPRVVAIVGALATGGVSSGFYDVEAPYWGLAEEDAQ